MKKVNSTIIALAAAAGLSAFFAGAAVAQDVKAGEGKVAMCIGCHGIPGYQASFPEIHKVPMISGQNAKFIVASLQAYKKGERKHPTMRGISESLSEQDMADIAAFYEQQVPPANVPETPARQPRAEVASLLEKGGCIACHGANFNKPIDGSYPKIAGQHADYLYVALRAYKIEGNPIIGRSNAIMVGQVKQFTDAELKTMANYIAALPGDLRIVPQSRFRTSTAR